MYSCDLIWINCRWGGMRGTPSPVPCPPPVCRSPPTGDTPVNPHDTMRSNLHLSDPSGGRMCVECPPSGGRMCVECPPCCPSIVRRIVIVLVVWSGACGGGAPVTGFHFCYRFPGFPISRCCDPRLRRGVRVSVSFAPYGTVPLYCIVPLSCILQCTLYSTVSLLCHRGRAGVSPA